MISRLHTTLYLIFTPSAGDTLSHIHRGNSIILPEYETNGVISRGEAQVRCSVPGSDDSITPGYHVTMSLIGNCPTVRLGLAVTYDGGDRRRISSPSRILVPTFQCDPVSHPGCDVSPVTSSTVAMSRTHNWSDPAPAPAPRMLREADS